MTRVFLSHTSKDKPAVRRVASAVSDAGIRVWLDEAEILPGESLIAKIGQGLEETSHLLAFISKRSVTSAWVEKELAIALTHELHGRRVTVIPVRLDDCEFPAFLVDKYFVDLRKPGRWNREIAKLVAALQARFWRVGIMDYYDAVKAAESTDYWRLPTFEEAVQLRREMMQAGISATCLWTSTWEDAATSYAVGFKKGERVKCFAAEHFGEADCVLIPKHGVPGGGAARRR